MFLVTILIHILEDKTYLRLSQIYKSLLEVLFPFTLSLIKTVYTLMPQALISIFQPTFHLEIA